MWDFINVYMYEGDAPSAERRLQALAVNTDLLQDLLKDVRLDELLRPEALADVGGRLQHTAPGFRARTSEELAVLLQEMGDLSAAEVAARSAADPGALAGPAQHGWPGDRALLIPTAGGMEPPLGVDGASSPSTRRRSVPPGPARSKTTPAAASSIVCLRTADL